MINPKRKLTRAVAFAILFCFTSLTGAQPLYAIPPNTQLPTCFESILNNSSFNQNGNVMDVTQTDKTAINKWENFSIGADATVNFKGPENFNSLNFVNSGAVSEIYGQLTATNNGNIFIANPAGVTIGNSAQINVGSLYVTNKDVGNAVKYLGKNSKTDEIVSVIGRYGVAETNAQLMSLGAITNATNVTFDGARIVLDTDRIYTANKTTGELEQVGQEWFDNLHIRTTDKDNVVLGYTKDNPRGVAFDNFGIKVVDNNGNVADDKLSHGYMWVHDLDELQAMGNVENLNGWYALRNSIDAYNTASMDDGKGFDPIGDSSQAFTGRFDGLGYNIFVLTINREKENNVGLFGHISGEDAVVRNLTINDGEITGNNNVGSVAGLADGGARIEKITNTADVTGHANVGGIVGNLQSGSGTESRTSVTDLVNIGTIRGHEKVGGIIGYAEGIDLKGIVYNIGGITGIDIDTDGAFSHSVGGLIGEAKDSTIGDGENQIYNQLGVTGGYDVGGIVGYVHGDKTEIKNAANYGDVTATEFMTSNYQYHTLVTGIDNLPHNAVVKEDDYGNSLATIESVYIANAGGIAGRSDGEWDDVGKLSYLEISDVQNYGNVTSVTETKNEGGNEYTYHTAGNVGGIVGSATNTNITNAENSENKISGAHNVGGIAGYLARESKISGSSNDGGEITATGARNENGFVQEWVSNQDGNEEKFNIGNAGGIVGYLFGPEAKITNSGNRGNVHTEQIKEGYVPPSAKAANVGGIAGKVGAADQIKLSAIKDDYDDYAETGTISNSYNTGEVRGYTGVGGIAGHMYKGAIVGSYNLGTVQTTRRAGGDRQDKDPLNMGGIVGDTSTLSGGKGTVLYDVYNAGQIGDETFEYYGRHVGGVAGRLSGDMEKAYNTGEIYNGYSVVGGVVGWWVGGNIKNVFNTGNITVLNNDKSNSFSEVGGIVGAYGGTGDASLTYAYNLGTLRSIKLAASSGVLGTATSLGGIIGRVRGKKLTISNVYTTNNLYAAQQMNDGSIVKDSSSGTKLGTIYGDIDTDKGETPTISNSYFVKLYDDEDFNFNNLETQSTPVEETSAKQQNTYQNFTFRDVSDADDSSWRIYEGSTLPILNAFTPYAASKENEWNTDGWKVQYGTAANPLLTIITADGVDVNLNVGTLGLTGAGSLAVYGNTSLTLTNFNVPLGGFYNGVIYSDGDLTIETGGGSEGSLYNLGSGSRLYGSSVTFDAKGEDATFYGKITATDGGVTITGGKNITVLGELSTPTEDTKSVEVNGISKEDKAVELETGQLNSIALENKLQTIEEANAHTTDATTNTNAGIDIDASGRAEILYGNMGDGRVTTAGDFSVSGKDSVYIDSDLHIGKDLNLRSDGEIVLDLSNMGSYDSVNEKGETISGKREPAQKLPRPLQEVRDYKRRRRRRGRIHDSARHVGRSHPGKRQNGWFQPRQVRRVERRLRRREQPQAGGGHQRAEDKPQRRKTRRQRRSEAHLHLDRQRGAAQRHTGVQKRERRSRSGHRHPLLQLRAQRRHRCIGADWLRRNRRHDRLLRHVRRARLPHYRPERGGRK